jgi:multidrug efflux pump
VLSRFFIGRPIFAAVLSIVIVLAGALSIFKLAVAQFPSITPPTVSVTCTYPGASAKEVSDAVAAPIEQQVNGVERMMYMSSQCANDGSYSLSVTFFPGIDVNVAQVLVQNRVNLAVPQLPDVIKQTGVITRKRSPDILMGMALNSPSGRYDQLYLSNFALMQVKDELARVPGVADVFLFGERDYSMRIWLNPDRLAARGMTPTDVVAAIREQNAQVATGAVGQEPMHGGQESQITLNTLGRLSDVEQFENIVLKTGKMGRIVRLKDVARVEMGAKNEDIITRLDGHDTVFLAIFQMPDANALDVREAVLAKLDDLKPNFPDGIEFDIGFDTTPYTRESIYEVVKTLRDAVFLVAAVVLLFLQNWRSAVIPLVAVPVAIIGTFAVMAAMGFSLNNLTMFGLVLAIGIVVDDAIVVVEAVEHHIENGLSPREATITAMHQVQGPVIAVGLVLSSVFVPCAFIPGITGAFFRQFAVTIAVSTIISAFNSLTLSPALAALLLRARDKETAPPLPVAIFPIVGAWLSSDIWVPIMGTGPSLLMPTAASVLGTAAPWVVSVSAAVAGALLASLASWPLNWILRYAFLAFNAAFRLTTAVYVGVVGRALRYSLIVLFLYAGLLACTYYAFQMTPKGFIPSQDMGYLMMTVQLPDSASTERTEAVMRKIEEIALKTPGIRHITCISGQSFMLNAAGSNFGSCFVNLKDYADRRDPSLSSDAIIANLRRECAKIEEAEIGVFGPPPVRGIRAGGFALMVEDRGDLGPLVLQEQTDLLKQKGSGVPGIIAMFSVFRANVPQYHITPDTGACTLRSVTMGEFAQTLSIYEGSLYVNDFNRFGRTWQVIVQAEPQFRSKPEDVAQLRTRNYHGGMVPIGSVAETRQVNGPLVLTRYNMYPAASLNGMALPFVSSSQIRDMLGRLADQELPRPAMAYEWTDMSYLEQLAGYTVFNVFGYTLTIDTVIVTFGMAAVMVFLVLAAQYESWSLPLAIILVVPMCLLSAIVGVMLARMDINIFTQIGFVVLVGLASKNAILIVEFAKVQRHHGSSRRDATLEACKLRIRPIVMTSFAFILGVVPLILSQGAGAEMRRTLGIAVFSGMIGVTLVGIVLTPVFFFTIDWLGSSRLFASRILRRLSNILIDVISLRPVRFAAKAAVRRMAVQSNGQLTHIGTPVPTPNGERGRLSAPSLVEDNGHERSGNGELPNSKHQGKLDMAIEKKFVPQLTADNAETSRER